MLKEHDRGLAVALVGLWAAVTLVRYWGNWSIDLSALYFAARFYDQGDAGLIYNFANYPPWQAARDAFGHQGMTLAPFIYPPWVAGLLAPLARAVSPQTFFNAGYVVHIACLAASILMAARIARPAGLSLLAWSAVSVALLLTSFVSALTLDLNQPQNLVNAMTLLAVVLALDRREVSAGTVLALAALIKLTPAVFAVVFIAHAQWRALAAFAVVTVGLATIGVALSPPGYVATFGQTLDRIGEQVLLSRINHSIESVLYLVWAWLDGLGPVGFDGFQWVAAPAWIGLGARALMLAGIAASLWATRGLGTMATWPLMMMVSLWLFLAGPLGWTHYLILPLLLLPGALGPLGGRSGWSVVIMYGLAFQMTVFERLTGRDLSPLTAILWGMAWPAAGLVALYVLAARLRRSR